jgi:Rieske Fe-S protein
MSTAGFSRRAFVGACGSVLALASRAKGAAQSAGGTVHPFSKARLVWAGGAPLKLQDLATDTEYVFHYPYHSTPCFLIRLSRSVATAVPLQTEDGREYRWHGGIGPEGAIVAFSAICAHKLSHPSAAVSFIGYRREPVRFLGEGNKIVRRQHVIQCCSEHSIYDPAQGARVVSGPAPQPLASIDLVADDDGAYAQGVVGGDVFERYFERFGFRLGMEFGEDRVRQTVAGEVAVTPMTEFTRNRIQC